MSRKFKVWLDSGANHDSCKTDIVSLDDLGIKDEEWCSLTTEEQDNIMREVAFDRSDWGYREI